MTGLLWNLYITLCLSEGEEYYWYDLVESDFVSRDCLQRFTLGALMKGKALSIICVNDTMCHDDCAGNLR